MVNEENEHVLLELDGTSAPPKESNPSSSSSSSGYSSDDEFIQFDAIELGNSNKGGAEVVRTDSRAIPPAATGSDAPSASVMETRAAEMAGPNPFFSSHGMGYAEDESSLAGAEQSPVAQVMTRSDVPDPSRIPPSIFERTKSTRPVEWSVASNESLFSIRGGNSSFSRDHIFLIDRSGELPSISGSPHDPYPLPVPAATGPAARRPDMGICLDKQSLEPEAANAKDTKHDLGTTADDHAAKEKSDIEGTRSSASMSRLSDESSNSFAFPILAGARSGSGQLEPLEDSKPEVEQQPKADDQKEAPKTSLENEQSSWFSCCACSFCQSQSS